MRYYSIQIIPDGQTQPIREWTSHPKGVFDPNSPLVEFDIPMAPYHTPKGGAGITIHGISLEDLTNAQQFYGMNMIIKGGFQTGLPLANPKQAGLLISGMIWQSFGNWEGTEMTLDFVIQPSGYNADTPGNVVLLWTKGSELGTALSNCLSILYPGVPLNINLAAGYVLNHDEIHTPPSLESLSTWLKQYTKRKFGRTVNIVYNGAVISVYDGTSPLSSIEINFNDFIGQPTWIDVSTLQAKFAMRADLQMGSVITMPKNLQNAPGITMTRASSMPSQINYKTSFQGQFLVNELRHIGNSRSSEGASWATVANCIHYPIQ